MNFNDLNLNKKLILNLQKQKFSQLTAIQTEVIPYLLEHSPDNFAISSNTGSGKTLAYLVPLLHFVLNNNEQALIIAPTRELAFQIFKIAEKLLKSTNKRVSLVASGMDKGEIAANLRKDNALIIATVGKIPAIKDFTYHYLVLDEIDLLKSQDKDNNLSTLFKNAVKTIKVSATLQQNQMPANIQHSYLISNTSSQKKEQLLKVLNHFDKALIFLENKVIAKMLQQFLEENNLSSQVLINDLTILERRNIVNSFNNSKLPLLITTDILSHGFDNQHINLVVHWNLPSVKDYIHRSGRAGRLGQASKSVVLLEQNQINDFQNLQNLLQMEFQKYDN
jgi:ATP-dependent RNA helicase SrmB